MDKVIANAQFSSEYRSNPQAPPLAQVPDFDRIDASSKNPRKNRAFKHAVDEIVSDPDNMAKFEAECEELEKELANHQASPNVLNRLKQMEERWVEYARDVMKKNSEQYFLADTFKDGTLGFLELLARIPGRGENGRIAAGTLEQYKTTLNQIILRYCCDPNALKAGMRLLTVGGLYGRHEATVRALTIKYKLSRHVKESERHGPREVRQIAETVLKRASGAGRGFIEVAIQLILLILISLFTSCRPGSLGWSYDKLRKEGKYPKMRDVRVYRLPGGPMRFQVDFDIVNLKNGNDTIGKKQIITFLPVESWTNVLFDPTVWWILHLFLRGAFKNIDNLDDLLAGDYTLEIKEEMLDDPLFLASDIGGRGFLPNEPISAASISRQVKRACVNAKLPKTGLYAYRKAAADHYSIILGHELTEALMCHRQNGELRTYEAGGGVAHLDVVRIRLGEGKDPFTPLMQDRLAISELHGSAVTAVTLLISDDVRFPPEVLDVKPTSKQVATASLNDSDLFKNKHEQDLAWEALKGMVTKPPGNGAWKSSRSASLYVQKTEPLPGVTVEAVNAALLRVQTANTQTSSRKRHVVRKVKDSNVEQVNQLLVSHKPGTPAERQAGLASANLPSEFIPDAVQNSSANVSLFNQVAESSSAATAAIVANTAAALESMRQVIATADLTPEEEQEIENMPKIVELTKAADNAWATYKALRTIPTVDSITPGPYRKNTQPLPGVDDETEKKAYNALTKARNNLSGRKSAIRTKKRAEKQSSASTSTPTSTLASTSTLPVGPSYAAVTSGARIWTEPESDDEDDPDSPAEIRARNLLNFAAGYHKKHGEQVEEAEAEDLVVAGPAEAEKESPLLQKEIDASLVRWHMVNYLMSLFSERQGFPQAADENGLWVCPVCRDATYWTPEREWQFKARGTLLRHIRVVHTKWGDAINAMHTEEEARFQCPDEDCDFWSQNQVDVETHCLEDCRKKHLFSQWKQIHDSARHKRSAARHALVKGYTSLASAPVEHLLAAKDRILAYLSENGSPVNSLCCFRSTY
ncbi:hypothetical protein C8J56DRAFT_972273 [Mycena floridula]|nr:hypothetical protein C8J56DRAFT_972273 [Mycena floridula]